MPQAWGWQLAGSAIIRWQNWEHPDVDIGICACHFWLGLLLKNVDCKGFRKRGAGPCRMAV